MRTAMQAVQELFEAVKNQTLCGRFEQQLGEALTERDVGDIIQEGCTLLHAMVVHNRPELMRALLRAGCWNQLVNVEVLPGYPYAGYTARDIASSLALADISAEIDDHAAWEVSLNDVHRAARAGDLESVQKQLHFDAQNGMNFGMIERCFTCRKKVVSTSHLKEDAKKCSSLYWACVSGNVDIVLLLLEHNVNPRATNLFGDTLLHVACEIGHRHLFNILLGKLCLDPTAENIKGITPLHYVAAYGTDRILFSLLEAQLEVDLLKSVVALTGLYGNRPLLESILAIYGVDMLQSKDKHGKSALYYAVHANNMDVLQYVCENTDDFGEVDQTVQTPLHLAAAAGNLEAVKCLLLYDETVDRLNAEGYTASDVAERNGNETVSSLIIAVTDLSLHERIDMMENNFDQLINRGRELRQYDISVTSNCEAFDCPVCWDNIAVGEGVVLKECGHTFCRDCIKQHISTLDSAVPKCPEDCCGILLEREIRAIVSAETYEKYLQRSIQYYEQQQTAVAFHCRRPGCDCWVILEDNGVTIFKCKHEDCGQENCIRCKAIHSGQTCEQYQQQIAANNNIYKKSKDQIAEMIQKREAMNCPECTAVLTKAEGCDWLLCRCGTEICWATRGRRWGPKGKGDTDGGCRCKVDGKPCHESCRNCH